MSGSHSRVADQAEMDTSTGRTVGVAVLLWVAGIGGGLLVAALPTFLAALGGMRIDAFPAWLPAVSQFLFGGVVFAVGAGYIRRWLGGLNWDLSPSESRRLVAGGVLVAVSVWGVNTALRTLLEIQMPASRLTSTSQSETALALLLIYTALVAPIAEETLFRGAIQRRLRHSFGSWVAIGLASVSFLSIHALNFVGGSAVGMLVMFATLYGVSVVFGYVYERTDTLVAPVAVHAAYNCALVAGGLATGF